LNRIKNNIAPSGKSFFIDFFASVLVDKLGLGGSEEEEEISVVDIEK
jgi:hypothetical protein